MNVWQKANRQFWDRMWAVHEGSPMTEWLLDRAIRHERVLEVGCGWGHMLHALLARGWKGSYTGMDFTADGVAHINGMERPDGVEIQAIDGCFLDWTARNPHMLYDAVFAQGVVNHQAHWAPITVAALRVAPVCYWGIGYGIESGLHLAESKREGHYDTFVSADELKKEAKAMGLSVTVEVTQNPKRHESAKQLLVEARWQP